MLSMNLATFFIIKKSITKNQRNINILTLTAIPCELKINVKERLLTTWLMLNITNYF